MRNALLNYFRCSDHGAANFISFTLLGSNYLEVSLVDCERVGVHRRLGNNIISISVRRRADRKQWLDVTCGTRPFGIGIPMIPAMNVVHPRRKKSQWNPPGFLRGYCCACAVKLLTFYFMSECYTRRISEA